jgi:superfamily II DNA or RNA helicase
LASGLQRLSAARLEDLQPELTALHTAQQLAWHLVAQGAVVPQLFTGARRHEARARWLPALLDAEVRAQVLALAALLPPGLLAFARNDEALDALSPRNQAVALCGLFVDAAVRQGFSSAQPDKVLELLFGKGHARFEGPGEASLAPAAQQWLQRLQGQPSGLPLLLALEDRAKGPYALSLAVAPQNAAALPLAQVLQSPEVAQLQRQLSKPPVMSGAAVLRAALAENFGGAKVQLDRTTQNLLKRLREPAPLPPPEGLQAQLRPYQERGYAWLVRNAELGFGCLLADDMGLGKTLQVIAALLQLKAQGHLAQGALVVVPTTLLTNWQKELTRFAPGLSVGLFHGGKRSLPTQRPDVLLSTYGVVRTAGALLRSPPWSLVVADEAQQIKNPEAAQTRAIKALPAQATVGLSGTPVENRLLDAWSLLDFANPGLLGNSAQFQKEFAIPVQVHRDVAAAARFQRVSAPFLMRRLKSDKSIICDLPDKIEQNQYCSLSPEQVALYEAVLQEGMASLKGVSDAFERQGLVLQLITALKQVCNHPAQYLKSGARQPALSGKGERLLELLGEAHAGGGHKALVFTQFRETGELLCEWLAQQHGQAPAFLHGGVRRAQRDAMVERFQTDRTERVLVLSLKAGGTGLNLTAASQVLHFDLWWNPAVEAQATDRAYRIGQNLAVQVHRLITRATFEERIDALMRDKRELAELTIGSGETWIGKLPQDMLHELLALG